MITYTYDLDMTQGGLPLEFGLKQYDSDFTLIFNLVSKKGEFTIQSGTTAEIRGTKRDGHGYSEDCTISGNAVTVAGDQQMTAAAGIAAFELVLKKGDKELNTATFLIHVERSALDKDTISNSKIRELINVIDRTDEIIAAARQADAAQQSIAELTARSETAATNAESSEQAAEQAAEAAVLAMQTMDATIQERTDQAIDEIDEAYEENMAAIQTKGQQILDITTEADQVAAEALSVANNTENHLAGIDNQMRELVRKLDNVEIDVDDLGLEQDPDTYYVYPTYKGQRSENGIPLAGGGGGGGGGGDVISAVLSVENTSGWLSKTIAYGASCTVSFLWSSVEDEMPTGDGAIRITVNDIVRSTQQISQGNVSVDLKPYLGKGTNKVKVRISDTYDQGKTITFNISAIELTITSSFDATQRYTSVISFPYVPTGEVEKTVHFVVDGTDIGTQVTPISGRQITYTIPAQSHGGHSLRVYFEATINNETVRSNELYYEFISIDQLDDTVIITSSYHNTSEKQYTNISVPFMVYDPKALTAEVKIYVNNTLVSTQTVDRTEQSYAYKANDVGTLTFRIVSGGTTKTITTTVTESEIDVEPVTEDLKLYLTSQGRSNNEEHPDTWTYGEGASQIAATFTGFNWVSDGWVQDKEGITVMRVSGAARITIPYQIFATDFRSTGKTIELEFATRDVLNYDATILSCMSGGRGISVTAQKAMLQSEQSQISTQYKEDEHIRIAFVAQKRTESRLLYIYINGIASGVVQYPADDDFAQTTPVDISIGSSDCTIDLYNIRIYDNDLTRFQIVDNWIADTQDGTLMLDRFTRNNVFDAYGNIVIANLPYDLPYMIIEAAELPQSKGDKKTCAGSFVNPLYPSKNFTFTGCQIDVQGTSSQYYPRKNYKMKFKGGFTLASGSTADKYAMNANAIPVDTFCMKADFASSEGANNVELVRLYERVCPYKTPAQVENSKVRQGIDGFPILIFWNDTALGETSFLGKYNFNNDKSTEEVFGFDTPDESWEMLNNAGDYVLWKTADYTGSAWLSDFEARFPDTDPPYQDPEQLQTFAAWVVQTDTEGATDEELDDPVTYGSGEDEVTYTHDTAAYRLAKFKYEAGNYMELQSALFYYLFTELFLMVDSRAKNAFPSFIGTEVSSS